MKREQWICDANRNRASVDHFESIEEARKTLDSLIDCKDCTNCVDCTRCIGCADCFDCVDCKDCAGSAECRSCIGCTGCSKCSLCEDCAECEGCSRCVKCAGLEGQNRVRCVPLLPSAPVIAHLHAQVYAAAKRPGMIADEGWHHGKAHSHAGWIVKLAGNAGRVLEKKSSTAFAAMAISRASDPTWRMSNFYASPEETLRETRRLARLDRERNGSRARRTGRQSVTGAQP